MIASLKSIHSPTVSATVRTRRRIVIAGLPSPAGTWLVNACLLLLAGESEDEVWTGWAHDLPKGRWPKGPAIVRVHDYASSLADAATHIITSPRDLRDAVLALHRTFHLPLAAETLHDVMERNLQWEAKAGHSVPYEKLLADPGAQLPALADYLGIAVVPTETILPLLLAMLSPEQASAGQLMVEQPGAWRQHLPAPVVSAITAEYWWWLEAQGYEVNRPGAAKGQPAPKAGPDRPRVIRGFEADYDKLSLLKHLGFTPASVLDVGASNGPWSHTCAQVYPDATYYLVEALPELHSKPIQPPDGRQWHLFPVALGAAAGEVEMSVPKDRYGVYGASAMAFGGGKEMRKVRVPMVTIDSLVAEGKMAVPDLVKLDVQGFELEVVAGGTCLWDRTEFFIVETSLYQFWSQAPLLLDVMKYFDARGFALFDYVGEFRPETPGMLKQLDLMFINRHGAMAGKLNLRTG